MLRQPINKDSARYMEMNTLLSQLRPLLLLVRDRGNQLLSYKDVITSVNLDELLATTFKRGAVVSPQQSYCVLILKKLIITKFELLCTSLELINDVIYSYGEFKSILLTIDAFNQGCPQSDSHLAIELPDLTDVYINSHARWLSSTLPNSLSLEKLLEVVKFESTFSRALLGLMATYTALIKTSSKDCVKRREYVSEKVFSMNSSEEWAGWLDCLVPGAQSAVLRIACRDVQGRLWKRVAEIMVLTVEPLLQSCWVMKELVPWLLKAIQHEGMLFRSFIQDRT